MALSDQSAYWNKVAQDKTFTHPLDTGLLLQFVGRQAALMDYGCGYGRLVRELNEAGFVHVLGFDTSLELIRRAEREGQKNTAHIASPDELPVADNSLDGILLFAVLTCIPENKAQQHLMDVLRKKLKPGGIVYVSDYYLQDDSAKVKQYEYLDNDKDNFGVFRLPEGAVFRHHTKDWISHLFKGFTLLKEWPVDVFTMNGHKARAFQAIAAK